VAPGSRATRFPGKCPYAAADAPEAHSAQSVGDVDDLDVAGELRQELADVAGYGALALLTDRWTWRTWAAVVLAGMAWRVLGRE